MTKAKKSLNSRNINPNLAKAHTTLIEKGRKSLECVLSVIEDSDQPLVISEIAGLLAQRGTPFDQTYVRQMINKLVEQKKISQRFETPDERVTRMGGKLEGRGAHFTAVYYWAPVGKVPLRTKATTVKSIRKSTKKKKTATVTTKRTQSADVLINRIESMTNELALLKRVAELEKQLSDVRKSLR